MTNLPRDILTLICKHKNPQTLLKQLAARVGEGLRVDFCLLLADKRGLDSLASSFWHRAHLSFSPDQQFLSNPIVQNLWTVDHVVAIAELADAGDWSIPVKAILGVRTEFQGSPNGLILLGLAHSHDWTDQEAHLLIEIRHQIAIAFALVQLQQETSLASEGELSFPTSVPNLVPRGNTSFGSPLIKRLYELMRQQLEQQRQLNEMKDEIIAAISDRARNPLASMKVAINMLSESGRELPMAMRQNYWRILKQEWGNLNDLINHIVTLKKLKSQELTFHPQQLYLESLIQDVSTSFREQWGEPRKHLLLETSIQEDLGSIQTDPQHLKVILQELLNNAAKFSSAQTTVYLKIFVPPDLNPAVGLSISVSNTGLGIQPAEIPLIFEPFKRGKGITEKGIAGTGIGLALVKGLVELLGGTIEVVSTPQENSENYITQFTFNLPSTPPPAKDKPY